MNQNYEMFHISAVCCLLMKFSINPFSGPNPKRLDKCAPKWKIILNIYLLTEKRIQFWISKFSKGVGQWASEWPNKSWQSQSQNHLLQNIFQYIFQLLNGTIFVISICSQLTYLYDAQHGLVEKCINHYPLTLKVGISQVSM